MLLLFRLFFIHFIGLSNFFIEGLRSLFYLPGHLRNYCPGVFKFSPIVLYHKPFVKSIVFTNFFNPLGLHNIVICQSWGAKFWASYTGCQVSMVRHPLSNFDMPAANQLRAARELRCQILNKLRQLSNFNHRPQLRSCQVFTTAVKI